MKDETSEKVALTTTNRYDEERFCRKLNKLDCV
jgi:hypothetical protein